MIQRHASRSATAVAGCWHRLTTTMTSECADAIVFAGQPSLPGNAPGTKLPWGSSATRAVADRDDVRRLRRRGHVHSFSSSSASASAMAEPRQKSSDGPESKDGKGEGGNNKKEGRKDDSNIFLDNLGKIFLSTIGIVLLSLLRSTKSNNSRTALREDVESAALLDPLEIDDLRLANQDFTIKVWEDIVRELRRIFPHRRSVTYPEFLTVVTRVMRDVGGEGFTVQFGHLVDRVVIAELERIAAEGGAVREEGKEEEEKGGEEGRLDEGHRRKSRVELPLPFLLAALSLALHGNVSDRVRVLYESASIFDDDVDDDGGGRGGGEGSEYTASAAALSGDAASRMVQYLQRTCQLVPEAQIVETNSRVPYRTYRVGSGDELVKRARGGYGGKKGSAGVTREAEGNVTLEEFHAILRSRTVCAWGECYVKKTGKTATSDR
ncbi:hypothetical protein ACHAXA_001978 [Cyclostephanos tholiformis]|uniref:Uncharacterized protein n=1 Tax=Cyclostephanos tholiformis TaxID=382380 RepID=A0ABD3SDQ2_9STRA